MDLANRNYYGNTHLELLRTVAAVQAFIVHNAGYEQDHLHFANNLPATKDQRQGPTIQIKIRYFKACISLN